MSGRRALSMGVAATAAALFTFGALPLVAIAATPVPCPTPTATPTPPPTPTSSPTSTPASPSPCPTPTPSPTPTATPTLVPTPSPSVTPSPKGQLNVTPAAAPPESRVIVSGFAFLPNITVKIYFDGTEPPLATVTSDGAGAFSTPVVIPDGAGADHTICARTPDGDICASFRLQPRPSPSPVALPSPSTGAPSPSALPPTGAPPTPVADAGTSPVAFIAKPPFVFFPILLVAGLVGWLAYYLWGQRPSGRIQNVTVVHRAPVNRDYEQPPITPESPPVLDGGPPATEPNPTQPPPPAPPPVPETPSAPEPPAAPSSADVPPDLPGSDSDD